MVEAAVPWQPRALGRRVEARRVGELAGLLVREEGRADGPLTAAQHLFTAGTVPGEAERTQTLRPVPRSALGRACAAGAAAARLARLGAGGARIGHRRCWGGP